MCNKFLKLEHIAHKKLSYALRMIMSEIGLRIFSTYICSRRRNRPVNKNFQSSAPI